MWDCTYTQKRIISAFIKALQMKLLPSTGTWFTLRSVSHIKLPPLGKYFTRLDWSLTTWKN